MPSPDLGCRVQRGDRLLQMKLGFLGGAAHHSLPACAVHVLDRFLGVRAAAVLVSELAQMVIDRLSARDPDDRSVDGAAARACTWQETVGAGCLALWRSAST